MRNGATNNGGVLMPFPNAPLAGATGGGNPSVSVAQAQALLGLGYIAISVPVNFNAVGDTPIDIPLPQGFSTYAVDNVFIANASAPLNAAKFGLFTQAGGAGSAIVPGGTAVTVSSAAPDTANNTQQIALGPGLSESFNVSRLYFRVTTAAGGVNPTTGTVVLFIYALF
jgi:hypothetical protein